MQVQAQRRRRGMIGENAWRGTPRPSKRPVQPPAAGDAAREIRLFLARPEQLQMPDRSIFSAAQSVSVVRLGRTNNVEDRLTLAATKAGALGVKGGAI